MRTPIYVLIAALLFSGCTHYHAAPASSASRPVDRLEEPEPDPVEPLEIDVGRPSGGQLLLQTNRPAYVAIFEIIPNRGVTLIYPAAAHQQNMMVSGLTWVPLWWSPKRVTFNSDRYIYAVASEEPLQLSAETFVGGYFLRVLGARVFGAESPYSTMRAISQTVVPDVAAEAWAEDAYVLTPRYLTETYRTVRIHCPGGRVFDVPEEMVARVWCPTRARVVIIDASRPRSRDYPVGRPVRPDSVYGRGRWKLEPGRPRGPIARVVDPTGRDRDDRDNRRGRGRDARDEQDDREENRDDRNRDDRGDRHERDEKPEKKRRGLIKDLIKDAKEEEHDREKQEKERQRREADEARRREAEERKAERDDRKDERKEERDVRKDERDERKDERKDDRRDERDARKEEREEHRDDRKDDAKQQGQPRDDKRDEKRDEARDEKRDDNKRRGSIKDMIKEQKEKKEKEKKDKQDKDQS